MGGNSLGLQVFFVQDIYYSQEARELRDYQGEQRRVYVAVGVVRMGLDVGP